MNRLHELSRDALCVDGYSLSVALSDWRELLQARGAFRTGDDYYKAAVRHVALVEETFALSELAKAGKYVCSDEREKGSE